MGDDDIKPALNIPHPPDVSDEEILKAIKEGQDWQREFSRDSAGIEHIGDRMREERDHYRERAVSAEAAIHRAKHVIDAKGHQWGCQSLEYPGNGSCDCILSVFSLK